MNVLDGIRVVDLGNFITGPYSAMLLAELGADVIKVERLGTGDPFRAFEGGLYSPQFQSYNRHKRSIAIDYATPDGLEVLYKLLATADVVIVNNRPGVLENVGLGYERLQEINPQIVYCSVTGFGPDGPYADRPAYDTVGQAASGWLSLFHDGDDNRVAGPAVSDAVTGIFACLGILGALLGRQRSGKGCKVETSMLEANMAMAAEPITQFLATGVVPGRYSRGAMSQAYVLGCADDRRICLHMSSPEKFWNGLAKATARPDLLVKYPDRVSRIACYEEIGRDLAQIFREKPRDEWAALLDEHDVPFSPELNVGELEADPQVSHLNMFYQSRHPRYGLVKGMRGPIRYDGLRNEIVSPPPELGEHTSGILEELGFTPTQRATLKQQGVI